MRYYQKNEPANEYKLTAREKIRKLEGPIAIGYLLLLLVVYFTGRNVLEMFTTHTPNSVYLWVSAFMSPFILYTTLRLSASNGSKWYGYFGYLFITFFGLVITGSFLVSKADLLLSAALKPMNTKVVPVLKVKKVFQRKAGFDHTDVTILWEQRPLTLEARPNTFFLLQHKKTLKISTAVSFLGNHFITDLYLDAGERNHARWMHLKDWVSRMWYVPAFFLLMIIVIVVFTNYFPQKPQATARKIGFWKFMGILMGILLSIGIVLYLGLIIYVKLLMRS